MRIVTGLRKTSRLLIYAWAVGATVTLCGCGSRQLAAPSPSNTTTEAAPSDPCAPTSANFDPCGSRLEFWVEKLSDFDEELSHAIVVLGAPVPPHVLIREAIDPAAADDPFYAVEKLRSCSENLRFIGELPGGASSHPRDAASMATYVKACPKFEAAAAVFEEALKGATSRSSGFALMRTGQRLIKGGEAVLCDGGIGCPKS